MRKKPIRETDFQASELPSTRPALFLDVIKNQWRTLLATSMLLDLFAFPLIAVFLIFNMAIGGAYSSGAETNVIFSLFFYGSLASIPCIMVLAIGLSGSFEVAKKMAFGEGTNLAPNFFYGLKANWLRSLWMGLILGVSFALALLGSVFLLFFSSSQPVLVGIGIGVLLLQFIVLSIMSVYFLSQDAVYSNSFWATFKNSFLMTIGRIPLNFCFFLLAPGLFIAMMAVNDITSYVAIGLFVIFNFLFVFLWTLRTDVVFDKYINETNYPEYVRKGLGPKKEQ